MNLRPGLIFACFFTLLPHPPSSRAQDAGTSADEFVDVRVGELPIILSVPHGGTVKEPRIPKRLYGKLIQDAETGPLSLAIAAELKRLYGSEPHLIRCLLHRSQVDCNRDLEEGAQGNTASQAVWEKFHHACGTARYTITHQHGAGLLIDLHGHRHDKARVEIGCLISGSALDQDDMTLDLDEVTISGSSIRKLIDRSGESASELLRGSFSLGALLEQRGFPTIPSPVSQGPSGDPYFTGGYITAAHGSRDGGSISAIQMECPWEGVRDTQENRQRFATALAEALGPFFEKQFGMNLGQNAEPASPAP